MPGWLTHMEEEAGFGGGAAQGFEASFGAIPESARPAGIRLDSSRRFQVVFAGALQTLEGRGWIRKRRNRFN